MIQLCPFFCGLCFHREQNVASSENTNMSIKGKYCPGQAANRKKGRKRRKRQGVWH
jgi:hypothetical protein